MFLNRRIKLTALILFSLIFTLWCGPAFAENTDTGNPATRKLDGISSSIERVLTSMNSDLSAAAKALSRTGLDGPNAHVILADLCEKHDAAVDCCTVDAKGVIVAVEPASYRNVEGSNISGQEQVARLQRTKKPVLSKPFKAVEGFYALDLEWPVLSPKGDLLGAVSMIVRPIPFIEGIVKPHLSRNLSDVWVMQADGSIIYSRYRKNIGDNPLATPTYISGPTLNSLVKEIASQQSGIGHYNSAPVGGFDPMVKRCIWKTIAINDTDWRVVIFGKLRED